MKNNVGLIDRWIRVCLGVAMILFAAMSPDVPYAFIGWLGIIPLVTGLLGWCGIYRVLGISTKKND